MHELTENRSATSLIQRRQTVRKWAIVLAVLFVSHAVSATIGYDRLNRNVYPDLTINSPLEAWIQATHGMDVSSYLEAAQNFATGKGITTLGALGSPNKLGPFSYWGPGTPFILGTWLKWTGGTTIWSCFLFSAVAQLIAGGIAVATAALFTRRTWALTTTAALSGCFPPLHVYFYSESLGSSEIVALIPLGMMFFALCMAWIKRANPETRSITIIIWFGAAGLWIGLASLVRDSLSTFASFVAIVSLLTARPRTFRQWGLAITSGLLLIVATEAVRYPVKSWNRHRINQRVVSTSRDVAVWRVGLWAKHDADAWYERAGIGFGEYLDPEAAKRVEQYYAESKPQPALYSLTQLLQAVRNHPLEALRFKLSRLGVLWLGTRWQTQPYRIITKASCVLLYLCFFAYIIARIKTLWSIPAPLYLYPLFVVCALVLIHFEFRYTFPMWQMFIVLPAFWAAHLAERKAIAAQQQIAATENIGRTAQSTSNLPAIKELLGITSA